MALYKKITERIERFQFSVESQFAVFTSGKHIFVQSEAKINFWLERKLFFPRFALTVCPFALWLALLIVTFVGESTKVIAILTVLRHSIENRSFNRWPFQRWWHDSAFDWLEIHYNRREEFNRIQSNLLSPEKKYGQPCRKYNCIEINIYYIVSLLFLKKEIR